MSAHLQDTDVSPMSAEALAAADDDWERQQEQEREAFFRSLDLGFAVAEDIDDPVNTDVAVDFYLERLVEREAEIARNGEIAARRKAMIDAWLQEANAQHEREAAWLRLQIEAFARTYDFGKKKSRSLPHGTFGFRTRAGTLEIQDMPAAVAFAEANELEVKKTVNKTPLLAHFKATGEIPDGCEYVEGGESVYIKPGG